MVSIRESIPAFDNQNATWLQCSRYRFDRLLGFTISDEKAEHPNAKNANVKLEGSNVTLTTSACIRVTLP